MKAFAQDTPSAPAPSAAIDAETVIRFAGVSVVFDTKDGQKLTALHDFSLAVFRREIISLVGPSGCGKSTALRLIAGLVEPTAGTVVSDLTVAGGQAVRQGKARRSNFAEIGIAFQRPTLLPWLNVLDNVLYPVRMKNRSVSAADRDHARYLLTLVGLGDMEGRMPDELSGGMQQRAAICRSLVLDPRILLMDEPFGALDALTREELQFDLLRIHHETQKTILMVTHSIDEAVLLSDRVALMSARPGRLQELIDIDIPKPRSRETLSDPRFVAHAQRIREGIFGTKAKH